MSTGLIRRRGNKGAVYEKATNIRFNWKKRQLKKKQEKLSRKLNRK